MSSDQHCDRAKGSQSTWNKNKPIFRTILPAGIPDIYPILAIPLHGTAWQNRASSGHGDAGQDSTEGDPTRWSIPPLRCDPHRPAAGLRLRSAAFRESAVYCRLFHTEDGR